MRDSEDKIPDGTKYVSCGHAPPRIWLIGHETITRIYSSNMCWRKSDGKRIGGGKFAEYLYARPSSPQEINAIWLDTLLTALREDIIDSDWDMWKELGLKSVSHFARQLGVYTPAEAYTKQRRLTHERRRSKRKR